MRIRLKDEKEIIEFDGLVKEKFGLEYGGYLDGSWVYRDYEGRHIFFSLNDGINCVQIELNPQKDRNQK